MALEVLEIFDFLTGSDTKSWLILAAVGAGIVGIVLLVIFLRSR